MKTTRHSERVTPTPALAAFVCHHYAKVRCLRSANGCRAAWWPLVWAGLRHPGGQHARDATGRTAWAERGGARRSTAEQHGRRGEGAEGRCGAWQPLCFRSFLLTFLLVPTHSAPPSWKVTVSPSTGGHRQPRVQNDNKKLPREF